MSSRDTTVAHACYMSLSVLLEMELAALPGNSGERFSKGFTNPLVIITGDAIRPVHPSHHEALNEGRPMLSCFGKANRNTHQERDERWGEWGDFAISQKECRVEPCIGLRK